MEFATNLARQAGEIIRKNFTSGMKKEWKDGNEALTETDLAINKLVVDAISQAYPTHTILSEEETVTRENSEYAWVCDPVDGTLPFSHGVPTNVFAIALVKDGKGLLGVVYDPFMDRLATAEKGKGAFMNGKPIHVSNATSLKNVVVGVSNGHPDDIDLLPLQVELRAHGAKVINLGSIIYMGMLIATGDFAATIFHKDTPHDTAALKVIVEEAGGKVTDLLGNDPRLDRPLKGHVCSNSVLHDEILAMVKKTVKVQ
ncbi:MAG: hypothetical protein A3A33_02360 [Candidatus Yanofskybacteria bacterium RIFCSPLOWO2_01_FULL_49_25]|uniref:Inositol monophosphatase n=1 Tax=Candidatus Yanofskybacteria bacterium RIFCSPLOWO2_01_FULL_49_25 TaxID=1802701 RepID=A0A1F8GRZ1_9BACT|nr:MAG: hypothetical protein A3A33_02360 [Candidatus Yanofskybacteria bacterium RIFCSPLOWO2_01_FULL_49_25]